MFKNPFSTFLRKNQTPSTSAFEISHSPLFGTTTFSRMTLSRAEIGIMSIIKITLGRMITHDMNKQNDPLAE
jgi:hypothetical protein